MPFLRTIQIRFGKNAILLEWWEGIPFAFKICLATIGVAFFSASASVGALFYFRERRMSNGKRSCRNFGKKQKGISKEKNQFCLVYYDCVVCRNDGFIYNRLHWIQKGSEIRSCICNPCGLYKRKLFLCWAMLWYQGTAWAQLSKCHCSRHNFWL